MTIRIMSASQVPASITLPAAFAAMEKVFRLHGENQTFGGQVGAQKAPGRQNDDEIIVFDSTGTALQDVALAFLAYEHAKVLGIGLTFNIGD